MTKNIVFVVFFTSLYYQLCSKDYYKSW